MFFSLLTQPYPSFSLPLPQLLGWGERKKKVKTTTNKPRGFSCLWWWCCCRWVVLLSSCIQPRESGWCKPAGQSTVQMCAGTLRTRLIVVNMSLFVCCAIHSHKAWSLELRLTWASHWMASELFLAVLYIDSVAGCIALQSAIIAPVSPHSPFKSQPITMSQTKTNIERHTNTQAGISQYIYTHSTSTRGQRMNNAEVASEWKSPPLFPSFSPSLSNKEAMLPWRQWSLGMPSANYSLPCVKHSTNGCSNWCCCCHRHWNVIGRAVLFDWISDLVFERENISRSATCVPTYKICLEFFFFYAWRLLCGKENGFMTNTECHLCFCNLSFSGTWYTLRWMHEFFCFNEKI